MRFALLCLISCMLTVGGVMGQNFPLTHQKEFYAIIPADLPPVAYYEGRFLAGVEFEDRGGRNFLILSELWNRKHTQNTLYATHYVSRKEVLRQEWQREIGEKGASVKFMENSLRILDLDGDGYQEMSWAWEKTVDDVSKVEINMVRRGEVFVYQCAPDLSDGQFTNLNQQPSPLVNWMIEQVRRDLENDGKTNIPLRVAAHAPQVHVVGAYYQSFPEFHWFDNAGEEVQPYGDGLTWLRYARAAALLNDSTLLLLHRDGIGSIATSTRMHEMWMEFDPGTFLLTDWAWSEDGSKFAFGIMNKRKYAETQTAILVVDLVALEFREYPVRMKYHMEEIMVAQDLVFDSPNSLQYEYRPLKGEIPDGPLQRLELVAP